DRGVWLRAAAGERAVRAGPLPPHAPEADARQAVETLGDQGRRDVVRKVGDELRRRRLERGQIERQRVAELQFDVREAGKGVAEARLESPVERDRVHLRDALGEIRR